MKELLLCCLLVGVVAATDIGEMTADMSISEPDAFPGTDVEILCRVTNMDPGFMIIWYKAVVEINEPTPFNTITSSSDDFKSNERAEQIAVNNIKMFFYDK
jgi:hypothetical protein